MHNKFMDEPQAYLNGKFIPAESATISPTDAGFVLGATVAEQLRTFAGKLFRLEEHLARLEQSLAIVGIDPGMARDELVGVARELVTRNHRLLSRGDDLGLSIFVTPGVYSAYSSPGRGQPTVCLHTYPLPFWLWAEKYETGQALVTSDVEQVSPKSWPPGLKCRSRMHYYLADRKAAQVDPDARALLLDRQGLVTEASTANIMIYTTAEGILSPPATNVLQGITLAEAVKRARKLDIPVGSRVLTPGDVASADEVFLTSTPSCLLPVTRLDGRRIGRGTPGDIFRRLLAAWNDLVGVDISAQAGRFAKRHLTSRQS